MRDKRYDQLYNPGITENSSNEEIIARARYLKPSADFSSFQPDVKAYIMLLEQLIERSLNVTF